MRLPTNKSRQPLDPAASTFIEAPSMLPSGRNGKITSDVRDRFLGRGTWIFSPHTAFRKQQTRASIFCPDFRSCKAYLGSSFPHRQSADECAYSESHCDACRHSFSRNACILSTVYVRQRQCKTDASAQHRDKEIQTHTLRYWSERASACLSGAVSSGQSCLGSGTPLNQARARAPKQRKDASYQN